MKANLIKTGHVLDGKEILAVELTNTQGSYVKIYNYGAIINKFVVKNAHGEEQDIVLGFDDLEGYLSDDYLENYPYFGCVLGRVANRIKGGKFSLDGKDYTLTNKFDGNMLHGGVAGFDRKVWDIIPTIDPSLTMQYISPDGEEGFPGNVKVILTFKLTDDNELLLDYKATCDQPTPVVLSNHSYFNLDPDGGSVDLHHHRIAASKYLEQDETYNPTGNILPVEGTPYDFLGMKLIGSDSVTGEGYDQSFILDKPVHEFALAAETSEHKSGLTLSVYTTEPVAHFYTSKNLQVSGGKGGKEYGPFSAFCIETQGYPDAVNHAHFPSTILRPDQVYHQRTIYKVSHTSILP